MTLDPSKKFIDGPVNVARLEGKVDGVNKVIYLFMDFHFDLGKNERQCDNIFSTHVRKYFADNFKTLNDGSKTIDFFMEFHRRELYNYNKNNNYDHKLSSKYIWSVSKLLSKISDYDNEKNKIIQSDFFNRLRIHYMDIRDENITPFTTFGNYDKQLQSILDSIKYNGFIDNIHYESSLKNISEYKTYLNLLNRFILGEHDQNYPISNIIKKIREKYNNDSVKKIIQKYLNKIPKFIDNINNILEELLSFIESNIKPDNYYDEKKFDAIANNYLFKQSDDNFYSILDKINNFIDRIMTFDLVLYVLLTDLFMLRRFLDKSYITNGISYTGMSHSKNYMYILIHELNFKITHISYTELDIDKLNKIIKSEKSYFENILSDKPYTNNIFKYILPKYTSQCSDLTNFPDNFD